VSDTPVGTRAAARIAAAKELASRATTKIERCARVGNCAFVVRAWIFCEHRDRERCGRASDAVVLAPELL